MQWRDAIDYTPTIIGNVKVLMYTSDEIITEETVYFDGEIYLSEIGTELDVSGFVVCVKI